MDKRIWIGVGLVAVLGWLGYRLADSSGRTLKALVPPDALLILASERLQDTVSEQALRTQVSLRQIPVFDEASVRLERFLYAAGDTASVRRFVTGKNIRYSLHPASKNALDYIFYIPTEADDQTFLNQLTNPNPRQYRVLSHTFAGERIYDLQSLTNESVGSFLLTKDYLVGSTSGVLIENVARGMRQLTKLPYTGEAFDVDTDQLGRLSIRPDILQSLLGKAGSVVRVFLPEELTLQFRPAASRSHLIGYASDEIGNRRDVANLFEGQTPMRIQSVGLIPQTTATLYHIGVSDPVRFGRSLSNLLSSASSDFLRDRFNRIKPATEALYQSLGTDLLLCRLESSNNVYRQLLILKGRDVKQLSNAYQQAAYLAGASASPPLKTYLGHKVLLLNIPELPASLFSSLFTGFRQSWITQHGSYLVVANSEDVMQEYLQQLTRGTVWSADKRQVELLGQTLRPANFTAFVRLQRTQTSLTSTWPAAWQNLLEPDERTPAITDLENIAYQASYGNEKILSTLVLGRTTRRASQAVLNRVLLQKRRELDAPLTSGPVTIGSLSDEMLQYYAPIDGQLVQVVADETFVSPGLDGPIRSNTLAVDFLDNGRLQYLFMTDRTLYVTDPGQARPGLARKPNKPLAIRLPDGLDVSYLARPRGTQQRNLVALAAHQDGHIYALDRRSRTFVRLLTAPHKGPIQLPFQVITAPTGMEVLALQADGTLNRWRENGSQLPQYPARLGSSDAEFTFVGPALLPPTRSEIQTITEDGQLLRLNASGLIAARSQLYRPLRSGSFRLFPDEALTNWLLLRTTDTEVAVLDQQGNERFQVRALQSGRNNVRYHRLGAGVELITVKSGNFTTLYDLNGRAIGDRPIPSDFPVTLQFDERTNELYILSGVQKTVELFSIRLR
ncbi:hypothetical protein BN8_03861 [Fibrisoma limi BUZ 3]|uniref:Uncharacterized protein n=1 Tax=Fibrisoma limi BUZ 3 TaxID=1185876 RepID=I2GL90_9BACT|nr:hypothetical protein [Fibrisoma limi]CCH54666.1 hypothetical protein BN8_03861 [Fibrisoma limi BUZ 3]